MKRSHALVIAAAVVLSAGLAAGACRSSQGPAQDASTGSDRRIMVPTPSTSAEPAAAEPEPVATPPAPSAGVACAPTQPIKSTDPCSSALDCAPSALCHAPSCVDKAKAPSRPDGGVMCTMNLVCNTTDVGRCDCVDGVCALVAR